MPTKALHIQTRYASTQQVICNLKNGKDGLGDEDVLCGVAVLLLSSPRFFCRGSLAAVAATVASDISTALSCFGFSDKLRTMRTTRAIRCDKIRQDAKRCEPMLTVAKRCDLGAKKYELDSRSSVRNGDRNFLSMFKTPATSCEQPANSANVAIRSQKILRTPANSCSHRVRNVRKLCLTVA